MENNELRQRCESCNCDMPSELFEQLMAAYGRGGTGGVSEFLSADCVPVDKLKREFYMYLDVGRRIPSLESASMEIAGTIAGFLYRTYGYMPVFED